MHGNQNRPNTPNGKKTPSSYRASLAGLLIISTLTACGGETDPKEPPGPPKIYISEAATNNSIFLDEDGDSSDWLELHNASTQAVSLEGWTLSDNPNKPYLWTFPDIALAPGAYLVVWASDKNRATPQLHTNFKLSSDGEEVVLSDATGKEISRLLARGAPAGYSVGLNTAEQNGFFTTPTPGKVNSTNWFSGLIDKSVSFSMPGGENSEGAVELTGAGSGETIRYTLDSSVPTDASPAYSAPIPVQGATVIRARIFRDGFIPSATASRTFLPGENHELPVVTLISEPKNFFDETTGIYVFGATYQKEVPFYGANFWEDWEREIHLAFYEADGELGTQFDAGVKIFGGWSRANDQRSLSIFARSRYGTDEIEYPLFPDLPYDEFQALVLRNSGNDWMRTMLRDAVLTSLMEGSGLDYAAYRPTVTYLNGEYWGIYNLREKINEHFLASKHGVDADDIDLLEGNGTVVEGSNKAYNDLMGFMLRQDLTLPANYAEVESQIDIQNYILYQIAQIYFNNTDWPSNNIKFWKSPQTKWRWILYDVEFSYGLYEPEEYAANALAFATATNGPVWPNPPWSTLLFRLLLSNPVFEQEFINTFADALNSHFLPERVIARIDEYAAPIASEIPRHYDRWQFDPEEPRTLESWLEDLEQMRDFAQLRPQYLWQHLASHFELSDAVPLTLEIQPEAGQVRVNSLIVSDAQWSGFYFPGVPVSLRAEAKPGFQFSHWSDDPANTTASRIVDLAVQTHFSPIFVRADGGN